MTSSSSLTIFSPKTSSPGFKWPEISPSMTQLAAEKSVHIVMGIVACSKNPPAFCMGMVGFAAPFIASRLDDLVSRIRNERATNAQTLLRLTAPGPVALLGKFVEEHIGWKITLVLTTAGEVLLMVKENRFFAPFLSFRAGADLADLLRGKSIRAYDRQTLLAWKN